ncbi:hypothetical protein HPP92_026792 [Vanilla planifolia]|uniref:Uncharacterized protein n=1 Tax=Vanilla planifolia TaxID=51239 RepID=A0A835PB33_VANPL|nr:hypothetical protein HPP92_026792 [Vanilla planifolia]KAG0473534.1 hypothetical protein HPP92_015391 [Vanilla planifolia]
MEEEEKGSLEAEMANVEAVVQRLVETVEEVGAISVYMRAYKKQFGNLSRRIKLLAPMFEELKESKEAVPAAALTSLVQMGMPLTREVSCYGWVETEARSLW